MNRHGIRARNISNPLRAGRVLNSASVWVNQLREWRRLVKTQRSLSQLPDHLLRDIGLNRFDVRHTRALSHSADFQRRAV